MTIHPAHLAALAALVVAIEAHAQAPVVISDCGSLENPYGPYDYTNPIHKRDLLPIVEGAHLTADILALRRGALGFSVRPMPDIDYTLRAFPNHHLALDAMARLHRREGSEKLFDSTYTVSCWFQRARLMNPNDGVVSLIEGIHRFILKNYDEAEKALKDAVRLMPSSAEAHYNLGLLYVRLNRVDEAVEHATIAYNLGYPLPGLQQQLAKRGAWPSESN